MRAIVGHAILRIARLSLSRGLMRPGFVGQFVSDRPGYATLTLALIGLIFSSMLVIPFLTYTQTSLLAVRKASQGLTSAACVAAGVEYSLWRLRYEPGFAASLTLEDPYTFDMPCDDTTVPITITLKTEPVPLPDYLTEYAFADVVMAVDVVLAPSQNDMEVLKTALHAFVDAFDLPGTGDRYRIGLTRFGAISESRVPMTSSATALHNGVDQINQQRQSLGNAADHVAAINGGVAQYSTGLGDRAGIRNLMIVISDEDDTAGNSIVDIDAASGASGARIFAVGAHTISTLSLNAIATEPDADHVFYAVDYDALLTVIDEIVAAVIREASAGMLYDIEAVGPNGATTRVRALLTVEGEMVVISSQEA